EALGVVRSRSLGVGVLLGRSIPYSDHPKLRIRMDSNTWYYSSVLGISLPFYSHPSSFHSRPKQFPQFLEDCHEFHRHLYRY
ncbi:hypothetical protein B296_00030145, partial [Ensete ventricosum]